MSDNNMFGSDSAALRALAKEQDALEKLKNPLGLGQASLREYERMKAVEKSLGDFKRVDVLKRDLEMYPKLSSIGSVALDAERMRRLLDFKPAVRFDSIGLSAARLSSLTQQIGAYRRLELETIQASLGAFKVGSIASLMSDQVVGGAWATRLAAIRSPWAKAEAQLQSVRAITELGSLGAALKQLHPFDAAFSTALRADFGDWRNAPEPSAQVYVEVEARASYYRDQGFDSSLTDFDEPAFAEGLEVAELCEDYLLDEELEAFVPSSATPEEAAAVRRANKCHEYLFAMERQLRRFIHRKMLHEYGEDWVNKRLDSKLVQSWREKEEAARESGRTMELLIEAADFTDYEGILVKKDHFRIVFQEHFKDRESVQESFRRLRPLRLDAMHARSISKEDLLLAVAECIRIMRATDAS